MRLAAKPTNVKADIVILGPPAFLKSVTKYCKAMPRFLVVFSSRQQHRDPPLAFGLLRACGERPGSSPAEKLDELAPPHCAPCKDHGLRNHNTLRPSGE